MPNFARRLFVPQPELLKKRAMRPGARSDELALYRCFRRVRRDDPARGECRGPGVRPQRDRVGCVRRDAPRQMVALRPRSNPRQLINQRSEVRKGWCLAVPDREELNETHTPHRRASQRPVRVGTRSSLHRASNIPHCNNAPPKRVLGTIEDRFVDPGFIRSPLRPHDVDEAPKPVRRVVLTRTNMGKVQVSMGIHQSRNEDVCRPVDDGRRLKRRRPGELRGRAYRHQLQARHCEPAPLLGGADLDDNRTGGVGGAEAIDHRRRVDPKELSARGLHAPGSDFITRSARHFVAPKRLEIERIETRPEGACIPMKHGGIRAPPGVTRDAVRRGPARMLATRIIRRR